VEHAGRISTFVLLPERDDLSSNRHPTPHYWPSMIPGISSGIIVIAAAAQQFHCKNNEFTARLMREYQLAC
jgi:hypothetical protein